MTWSLFTDEMDTDAGTLWKPQRGPQSLLLSCPVEQIFYGGARGGGKTEGGLGMWLKHAFLYGSDARGLVVRRTLTDLRQLIDRALELYVNGNLAVYRASEKVFRFKNGAKLAFSYLDSEKIAARHQGMENSFLWIEEAGEFPNYDIIKMLMATVRSPKPNVQHKILLTGNPGGRGHNWLKQSFIDPAPAMTPFTFRIEVAGESANVERVFIPARLEDNPMLMRNDPNYRDRLVEASEGRPDLLKAWLKGHWDIVAGGMFDDLWNPAVHIVEPFDIPPGWQVFRAYDWGSSAPFSIGWWAVADGTPAKVKGQWRRNPKGTRYRVAEWYGSSGPPDHRGLRMLEKEIAHGVLARERQFPFRVRPGPADISIFERSSTGIGISLAQMHSEEGVYWIQAEKGSGSRISGWNQMRQFLRSSLDEPLEKPAMFIFSNCREFIRTVPILPRDSKNQDDVDTTAEDHIADETRYALRYKPDIISKHYITGI